MLFYLKWTKRNWRLIHDGGHAKLGGLAIRSKLWFSVLGYGQEELEIEPPTLRLTADPLDLLSYSSP